MKSNLEKKNEEALLKAFEIEELEERLEMAPWKTNGIYKGTDKDTGCGRCYG